MILLTDEDEDDVDVDDGDDDDGDGGDGGDGDADDDDDDDDVYYCWKRISISSHHDFGPPLAFADRKLRAKQPRTNGPNVQCHGGVMKMQLLIPKEFFQKIKEIY